MTTVLRSLDLHRPLCLRKGRFAHRIDIEEERMSGPQGRDTTKTEIPPTDPALGLTSTEVSARLAMYGANEVPEKKKSALGRFLKKFWGVTPVMLELTVLLTWALGNHVDSYIVLALLIFNALVSYLQEERANTSLELLRRRLKIMVRVKRDGNWMTVPARELVPGDIVRIRTGDIIPADMVIDEGFVETDQSSLTGESLTVDRGKGGIVYSGSIVRRGEATGTVTKTGPHTYFGRTAELVQIARPRLHTEDVVSDLVKVLISLVVVLILIAVAIGSVRGQGLLSILPLATILLVAAIPIALPSMFNITMALGSRELAGKGIIVTRLSASEDAATMDVLCVDKTGTLTENKLSISAVVPLAGRDEGQVLMLGALASVEANRDPIDMAIISAAKERGIALHGFVREKFVPFSPSTRRTEAVIRSEKEELTVVKGALSSLLSMSEQSDAAKKEIVDRSESLSIKGYRVLGIALKKDEHLEMIGLIALYDRPRKGTAEAIQELIDLGISVKMLTGDSEPIARETARAVGLGSRVQKASDLKEDTGRALRVDSSDVFAEVYPEDKYVIVKGLQDRGHIVGMTGDGVNDAPALKQAEVGIAVSNATDVAKRAASVVLSECGMEGIKELVKTGRTIYQRILTCDP